MAKFYTLTIADIKRETTDAVSIAFNIPDNLKELYLYKPGQYLTFKMQLNGQEVRRSYSISSSPITEKEVRIAVKEVEGGLMSTYLNKNAKVGDSIEVMTPMGNFTIETNIQSSKNYVFFAGGSGVTPIVSLVKTILSAEPQSRIILFYANRNEFSVIYKTEIETLANNNTNLQYIPIFDQAPANFPDLQAGLMTKNKIHQLLLNYTKINEVDDFFVCGPSIMMDNVVETLQEKNVDKKKIHVEYFTTVLSDLNNAEKSNSDNASSNFKGVSHVTIILDGETTEFELDANGDSILDAAINAGADVPFSCKGAVCCTCRAKVMEGEVAMDMNYALEDDEVENGFVLTCQSHPKSTKVVVDYDQM